MPIRPVWALNEVVTAAKWNQFLDLAPEFGIYWQELGVDVLGSNNVPIPTAGGTYNQTYATWIGPILGDFLYVSIDTTAATGLASPRLELTGSDGTTTLLRWTGSPSHGENVPTKMDEVIDISDRTEDVTEEESNLPPFPTYVSANLLSRIVQARVLASATDGFMNGVTLAWGTSSDILDYGDQFQDPQ